MTRFIRAAAAVLLFGGLLVATPTGTAPARAYGSYLVFRSWPLSFARSYQYNVGDDPHCTATAAIYVRELGMHGVTRLRVSYELKKAGLPGWSPNFFSTSWLRTLRFPDDARNFGIGLRLNPGVLRFPQREKFRLWAKVVGERPGKDYTRHFQLGTVSCDNDSPYPGQINFST